MRQRPFFIAPRDLANVIGTPGCPRIVDARAADVLAASPGLLPTAVHLVDEAAQDAWLATLPPGTPVVVACKAGHERSNAPVARWRAMGRDARVLEGGYSAWTGSGLPMIDRAGASRLRADGRSIWVTRRRPKIDRVACPWLIRRFLDPDARFLFVDPTEVISVAAATGAVPFDVEGVEITHEGDRCSFDTLLARLGLAGDIHLSQLAAIVRGADTGKPGLTPQSAGLLAISFGLSRLAGDDDEAMLASGLPVYDALLAFLRGATDETHSWPPASPA
jgi:rhodanese-related sulfurtransferase